MDPLPWETTRARRSIVVFPANEPWIPDQVWQSPELWNRFTEERRERTSVVLALAPEQAVVLPQLFDGERCPTPEQPAGTDEADERSRSERAAAEAKDVELVSLLQGSGVFEVLDQPVVCGADVGLEAEAESTARDLVERSGADAFEIELELSNRVCVEGVVFTFSGQTEVMQHIGRIVSIVPGAIETQHQASHGCHRMMQVCIPTPS